MRKLWEQLFIHQPGTGYHKEIIIQEKVRRRSLRLNSSFASVISADQSKYLQPDGIQKPINESFFEGGEKEREEDYETSETSETSSSDDIFDDLEDTRHDLKQAFNNIGQKNLDPDDDQETKQNTLNKYELIQYFFKMMNDHNVKVSS